MRFPRFPIPRCNSFPCCRQRRRRDSCRIHHEIESPGALAAQDPGCESARPGLPMPRIRIHFFGVSRIFNSASALMYSQKSLWSPAVAMHFLKNSMAT
jgi:hypothetical protein